MNLLISLEVAGMLSIATGCAHDWAGEVRSRTNAALGTCSISKAKTAVDRVTLSRAALVAPSVVGSPELIVETARAFTGLGFVRYLEWLGSQPERPGKLSEQVLADFDEALRLLAQLPDIQHILEAGFHANLAELLEKGADAETRRARFWFAVASLGVVLTGDGVAGVAEDLLVQAVRDAPQGGDDEDVFMAALASALLGSIEIRYGRYAAPGQRAKIEDRFALASKVTGGRLLLVDALRWYALSSAGFLNPRNQVLSADTLRANAMELRKRLGEVDCGTWPTFALLNRLARLYLRAQVSEGGETSRRN